MPASGHHGPSSSISSPQAAALPNYQLGELIGRGAFGAVYKALNWQTGETVAVKQIALGNIPPSELPEIMSEIDLLKNLDHPNVVQYRGFVKTGDFLWIILEYCENGSLTAICKKFGKFPEGLCQIYICQVLEGLLYLHEQGVIHRDIKGSNILATKEGSIKLADFGVATRVGGHDRSVVGSPYWMAPEVVEQNGATTASDIWSVGCVVIELLEGQPPYHELEPMPALFRIVNDDCPPLPDSASPVVRDFLLQCFQKDSNLRVSARKLLRHPWMVSARKQLNQTKLRLSTSSPSDSGLMRASRRHTTAYDETVQRVQAWNKVLDKQQPPPPMQMAHAKPATCRSEDLAEGLQRGSNRATSTAIKAGKTLLHEMIKQPASPARTARATGLSMPQSLVNAASLDEDKENDNWDSDFIDDIPTKNPAPVDLNSEKTGGVKRNTIPGNTDTIRATAISRSVIRPPSASVHARTAVEDWSDLVPEEEAKPFEWRLSDMKKSSETQKGILHPRDLSCGTRPAVKNCRASRNATVRAWPVPRFRPPSVPPSFTQGPTSRPCTPLSEPAFERYSELENEDYSDAFADRAITRGRGNQKLELTKKLSSKSWLGDNDFDEEDPFSELDQDIEAAESNDSLEANVHRDKIARMCSFVNDLLDGMNAEADELAIRDGCIYLIDIFEQVPEVKLHFIKSHGLLTIVESLQGIRSREVMGLELRIVNSLIADNPSWLEKICLIGGCPIIMKFSHSRYSRDIRLEAALFIGAMCRTSLLTLQMFISCRGLRTLIDMMDENYRDQKDLVWMAIDGICRVFDMQGATPRNDFCRMFAKEGLLDPLSGALLAVAGDEDDLAQSALFKIMHILLIFSQSDLKVKLELAQRPIALRLIRSLSVIPQELLPMLLKTIKNISMAPAALEILQNANVIESLVRVMITHLDVTEICNPLVNALYNLCRLSKSRQEEAALAGAVPALTRIVKRNSPLKQFALPIICDFAHASKTCRKVLWQHRVTGLYIELLKDPFWSMSALEAILAWMQDETARIEDVLLEDVAIEALLNAFSSAKTTSLEHILEPLLKILRLSPTLCNKLSAHATLFRRLLERLSSHPKAVVRLNLLRLIKTLFEASPISSTWKICKQPNLVSTVNRLVEDDPSLLVKDLAKGMLKDFSDAEKRLKGNRLLANAAPLSPSPSSPIGSAQRIGRTCSDSVTSQVLSHPSTSSPRYKLKPRPNSPSLQPPTSPAVDSASSAASSRAVVNNPLAVHQGASASEPKPVLRPVESVNLGNLARAPSVWDSAHSDIRAQEIAQWLSDCPA